MLQLTRNSHRREPTFLDGIFFTIIIALVGGSQPAMAQNTGQADAGRDESALEEVLVTGSRIARSTFDTPTPVTIIDNEMIERTGFNNLGDILLRSPAVGIGLGTTNAWYNNDVGANFVNLRGLGVQRTLVLIDGHRRVAGTQSSSAVDLSTIPANMVERIEIITGGASAVYGADAVTGVVNVILKSNLEGTEFSFRGGINGGGDAQSYAVGVHTGAAFSEGRGNLSFGATYVSEDPLFLRDRKDLLPLVRFDVNPNPPPSSIAYEDWRVPLLAYSGAFFVGSDLYTVDPNLRLIENDIWFGGAFGYGGRDCYCPVDFNLLRHEQDVFSALTKFDYELFEDVSFFGEASFSNSKTVDFRVPTTTFFTPIKRENPFIPDDLGAFMDELGLEQVEVSRANWDHGIQSGEVERNTFTAIAGLRGELGDTWDWELFYQYGEYDQELHTINSHISSRFGEATDAIRDPVTGETICRSAEARAQGCAPLNILGPNVASPEALDYILHTRILNVGTDQKVLGANIVNSDLFQLPAGPVSVAFGFEYREDSLSAIDDPLAAANLLFIDDSGGPPIFAKSDVKEAYLEAIVPLVSQKPFAEELSLEGAVRLSDYSTIGNTTAWKLGANWSTSDSLRFRGTVSRSVRPPSLAELFSPGFNTPAGLMDPCDATRINDSPNRPGNCQALGLPFDGWVDQLAIGRQIFFGGNPDLQEETSDSVTVGFILTPESVEGLRIAIDYWTIDIKDAINTLPLTQVLERCVDVESIDNPFCALIERAPTFEIMRVNLSPINIGKLEAEGIDFQLAYDTKAPFGLPGSTIYNLYGTYVSKLTELVDVSDPDTLIIKDGAVSNPTWRVNAGITYLYSSYQLDLNFRFIDSAVLNHDWTADQFDILSVPSRLYTDVRIRYEFSEKFSAYFGVNNLFETNPPRAPGTTQGRNVGSHYDNIGRYFLIGANLSF